MPQPKRATAAKPKPKPKTPAALVAVGELTDQPITCMFRESVEVTLPAKLPATFTLDLAQVQGKPNDLGGPYRLIVSILGEEQWLKLREKIADDDAKAPAADDDEGGGVLGEIISFVIRAYNTEPGESRASGIS